MSVAVTVRPYVPVIAPEIVWFPPELTILESAAKVIAPE